MTTQAITIKKSLKDLRIASLLPSTTDICIALGLQSNVVGITHECDFPSSDDGSSSASSSPPKHHFVMCQAALENNDVNHKDYTANKPPMEKPLTLTVSHIDPHKSSQAEIDLAVKNSLHNGLSLYNLHDANLAASQPDIILTQSLCEVCAVAKDEVDTKVASLLCRQLPSNNNNNNQNQNPCRVLSLEPESLVQVADTFITIANACGVPERGEELHRLFWEGANQVLAATPQQQTTSRRSKPKLLFLEWIDPPFNGGHWIPDMVEQWSGCLTATSFVTNTCKSVQLTWQQVYDADPDLVMVACCGFDLKRNESDALAARELLKPLRAFREKRIYAADGNLYFARPGPALREGMAILARCAYDGEEEVVERLEGLGWLPEEGEGWSKVVYPEEEGVEPSVPDLEDLIADNDEEQAYAKLHDEACSAGKDVYIDPKTGYSVFTEVAHKKRGKCCGSGCRHCPYNHINVKDKTKKIQQPAFLYEGENSTDQTPLFASISKIPPNSHIKVLFHSGGKDSFLTIRKLVQQKLLRDTNDPLHLILLTTFDSSTRVIAHQEIPIETVLKQAQHLQIPLLAIPLRRCSGETYLSRIQKGLDAIQNRISDISKLTLVFGDLHLDHIREWREKELGQYTLEYPLWKTDYDVLMDDLERSKIRVVLSAATKDGVKEGMVFTRDLRKEVEALGMDGFGENGEFHSVAEVWTASREEALGL